MHRSQVLFLPLLLGFALGLGAAPWPPESLDQLAAAESVVTLQIQELEEELPDTPDLDRYQQEYRQAIPDRALRAVPTEEMSRRLREAPVVFLSDQHTLERSQSRTVQVLEETGAGGDLALVIEWVDRGDQPSLDAFLAGRMTLEDLRRAVEFDRLWGFPWEGYAEILRTARRLGVPVLAVDSLREHLSLGDRDQRITDTVLAHREAHPGTRYLVVYGCYHLAGRDHLPERMSAAGIPPGLTLTGDAPEAYWSHVRETSDPTGAEFLELAPDLYYVHNGAPLERDLSYRDYLLEMLGWDPDELLDQLEDTVADPQVLLRALRPRR